MKKIRLCATDEIAEGVSKGFSVDGGPQQDIFVVHRDDRFFAYRNHCPHTGVTLNWQDDQFLDMENAYIQCATHGALFQVEDGFCVRGPCAKQSLIPVTVEIIDGQLYFVE